MYLFYIGYGFPSKFHLQYFLSSTQDVLGTWNDFELAYLCNFVQVSSPFWDKVHISLNGKISYIFTFED